MQTVSAESFAITTSGHRIAFTGENFPLGDVRSPPDGLGIHCLSFLVHLSVFRSEGIGARCSGGEVEVPGSLRVSARASGVLSPVEDPSGRGVGHCSCPLVVQAVLVPVVVVD